MLRWWHVRPGDWDGMPEVERAFMVEAFNEHVKRLPKPKKGRR